MSKKKQAEAAETEQKAADTAADAARGDPCRAAGRGLEGKVR